MALLVAGLFTQTTVGQAKATSGAAAAPTSTPGSVYTPLAAPQRLQTETPLNSSTVVNGSGDSINVNVTPGGSAAPSGATAVVLVVTQTSNFTSNPNSPNSGNYVQVFPAGGSTTASAVNAYFPNQLVSNLVTVPVGTGGAVTLHSLIDCHVIVDEEGYYSAPSGTSTAGTYNPVNPFRLTNGANISGGTPTKIQVTGNGGVPAGATAATVNLTVTNDQVGGFLQTYPNTQPTSPQTSNLNYNGGGQIVATRDVVTLATDGTFTVWSNAPVTIFVDLNGWYGSASNPAGSYYFAGSGVSRAHDTRISGDTIPAGKTLSVAIAGNPASGVPTGATGAVLNVTIDKQTNPATRPGIGFLEVYPGTPPAQQTSDLNFPANSIVANGDYATLASDGTVTILNDSVSPVDVIVDSFGYFGAQGSTTPPQTTPYTITVTANPSTLPADGKSTSTVTATVNDANGAPVTGDNVTWSVSGTGCGTVKPASTQTATTAGGGNQVGQASTTYTAGTSAGTCTITASEAGNGKSGTTTITQQPVALQLTANPSTVPADGTATSTITATATQPNGSPYVGYNVYFTETPPGGGAPLQGTCTTDNTGKCTYVTQSNNTSGNDVITALLDTDFDGPEYTDTDNDNEPTASVTVLYTSGPVAGITAAPGSEDDAPYNGSDFCAYGKASGAWGNSRNCGDEAAVTAIAGQPFTGFATLTDVQGNPIPNTAVTFVIIHSVPNNADEGTGNSTCSPESSTAANNTGCTTTTQSATSDANGIAKFTYTETGEMEDYFYAYPTAQSSELSNLAEVIWGTQSLTITPSYTSALVTKQTNQNSSYSVNDQAIPQVGDQKCVLVSTYQLSRWWENGPTGDPNQYNPAAFVSGVTGGTAYPDSSNGCTGTPVDFTTNTTQKTVYVTPAADGTFSFTLVDANAGEVANPFVNAESSDFTYTSCDEPWFCGPVAIGAATQFGTPPTSAFNITITPDSSTNSTASTSGSTTYTESVTKNGTADLTDLNSFTFKQLVTSPATPTPGQINYVEVPGGTGGKKYCVAGAGTCPTADETATPPTGVTVTITTYDGSAQPNTLAQVKGAGTFMVNVGSNPAFGPSTNGTGSATAFGFVDLNNNQTWDSTEPSATGGTTTFAAPVGNGVSLNVYPTNNPKDAFANGQYFQPTNTNSGAPNGPGFGPYSYSLVAAANDQSGNPYNGTTQYAVNWTLKNTGATATKVYIDSVTSGASGNSSTESCTIDYALSSGGSCANANFSGFPSNCSFGNPNNGGTCNNTYAPTGNPNDFIIAGGQTVTFTTYTSAGCDANQTAKTSSSTQCSSVRVDSGDDTQLQATVQLASAPASNTPGPTIGTSASATVNWAPTPATGTTINGTLITYDGVETTTGENTAGTQTCPNTSNGTVGTEAPLHDWLVIDTGLAGTSPNGHSRRLVQFDQTPDQLYKANGTTDVTEDTFEATLATDTHVTVTNYNNPGTCGAPPSGGQINDIEP
jgi:adhesin/invasin